MPGPGDPNAAGLGEPNPADDPKAGTALGAPNIGVEAGAPKDPFPNAELAGEAPKGEEGTGAEAPKPKAGEGAPNCGEGVATPN